MQDEQEQLDKELEMFYDDDYTIMLDGKDFFISERQLTEIRGLYNSGMTIKGISNKLQKDMYEVTIALLHLRNRGNHLRGFEQYKVRKDTDED